jgi:hypothetical protein
MGLRTVATPLSFSAHPHRRLPRPVGRVFRTASGRDRRGPTGAEPLQGRNQATDQQKTAR